MGLACRARRVPPPQDLTNANLGQCNLDGADLTGALSRAARARQASADVSLPAALRLHPYPPRSTDANLSGAILSSARLGGATIKNADFSGVILRKASRLRRKPF